MINSSSAPWANPDVQSSSTALPAPVFMNPARMENMIRIDGTRRVWAVGHGSVVCHYSQCSSMSIPAPYVPPGVLGREWEPRDVDFVLARQWLDSRENWRMDWPRYPGDNVDTFLYYEALPEREEFEAMEAATRASQLHLENASKFRRWRFIVRDALGPRPVRKSIPRYLLPLRVQMNLCCPPKPTPGVSELSPNTRTLTLTFGLVLAGVPSLHRLIQILLLCLIVFGHSHR